MKLCVRHADGGSTYHSTNWVLSKNLIYVGVLQLYSCDFQMYMRLSWKGRDSLYLPMFVLILA